MVFDVLLYPPQKIHLAGCTFLAVLNRANPPAKVFSVLIAVTIRACPKSIIVNLVISNGFFDETVTMMLSFYNQPIKKGTLRWNHLQVAMRDSANADNVDQTSDQIVATHLTTNLLIRCSTRGLQEWIVMSFVFTD